MSFLELVNEWRSDGKHADADLASAALQTFRETHPQVFENLEIDDHLRPGDRQELLKQLTRVDPHDERAVCGKVESFCRAHEGRGPEQKTAQRSTLGHVHSRELLNELLTSAGNWASPFRRRGFGAGLVIDLILSLDLAQQQECLDGIRLSRYQMWSFCQSRAYSDPFRGVSKTAAQLARRLGLGHLRPPVELIIWTHRLRPHQRAAVPTTFDAALYEFYRPGGKTRPIKGTDGLREVVHPPISGDQLTQPIEAVVE
jgi:hypothetical protein